MEWFDNASGGTPLSAENLNNMIEGIDEALAREIDFESLAQDAQDIINSKMGFGFCPTDSGTFNSYTDPNKIYTTTHTDGVEYFFFTIAKYDNTLKAQFRFSVNGIEMRTYDSSNSSWGSFANICANLLTNTSGSVATSNLASGAVETSKIADNAVTYDKLSSTLQAVINDIPQDDILYRRYMNTISTSGTFNSSTYCLVNCFYQFTADGDFAAEIGVDDGDECEMRYVGGYQVVTKIATQEVILRQVYRVAPIFSAGEWTAT